MLREGVRALDLEVGRTRAGDGMEEDRLLDRRDERMAGAAEHGVVRPDGEPVLSAGFERARVVLEVTLRAGIRRAPGPSRDVVGRDEGVRGGVTTGRVHEPGGMEDLVRPMRVQRRHDLGDRSEVAVDELAQPAAVGGCSGHEELEARRAEGVLAVHDHEPDPLLVVCSRREIVLARPALSLCRSFLVWHPPDFDDALRMEVRRDRQLGERHRRSLGAANGFRLSCR